MPLQDRGVLEFIDEIMRETRAKALVDKRGRLRLNFLTQQAVKIAYDQRIGFFFDLFKFFLN